MIRWLIALLLGWICLHFVVSIFVPFFIPYLGFFPYKDISVSYHLPAFLTSLANFDGEHYLLIAKNGYSQFEQAFFPLYPILIRFVGNILGENYLLSGLLISTAAFFTGLFFLKKYLQEISDKKLFTKEWIWILLFLLLFPTSFFFTTVYTEGLFFLLFVTTLYSLKKKQFWVAALLSFLTAFTRLIGVFIFIPILFSLYEEYTSKKVNSIKNTFRAQLRSFLLFVAPFLGLISYCWYLWKTTGDPLFFLHAQSAFGANRSSHLVLFPQVIYRYIKIFFHSQFNFQYFASVIEFSFFIFVLIILIADAIRLIQNRKSIHFPDRISLNIFSFINLLLPTFTGTFSSIPRYVLMSFSIFFFLGELKNNPAKIILLTIFTALHILLFGLFIQGYFVS